MPCNHAAGPSPSTLPTIGVSLHRRDRTRSQKAKTSDVLDLATIEVSWSKRMNDKFGLRLAWISSWHLFYRRTLPVCAAIVLLGCGRGDASMTRYHEIASFHAPEAYQAAAADGDSIFAIEDTAIAKYDRRSFKLVARSTGTAHHLNSGFVWEGTLYCAHTSLRGDSEIVALHPGTMELRKFKDLSNHPGKITWVVRDATFWWVNFAFYGSENAGTHLAKFDQEWQELGRWHYPREVISDLGGNSISGGVLLRSELLVTGHDKKVIYRLKYPEEGQPLQLIEVIPSPFPGQGIASDPVSGGLIGIDRNRHEVVFARLTVGQ
ncbi:MAG: Endonuclease/exonuclease/phosphatase [Rhodospirillales bacterium]|nr:Endonuclease/exonuclease/phosphatase [Rhodospirillales bacterium]